MSLSVQNLTIKSPQMTLLHGMSFTIENGHILSVMGPSGCGKSTLLSAIAGHLSPEFECLGDIHVNGKSILALPAEKRAVGILFQDDLLFPHLNVWQNLAFGLPDTMTASEKKSRALQTLEDIDLADIAYKAPQQISGGQRARVSLMRTLLSHPNVILLDEPFSKLDKPLRKAFRAFVFQQIKTRNIAAVMVTHDEDDVPEESTCLQWPLPTASDIAPPATLIKPEEKHA
ncbi:ATP-binding cassette domain-containing protein [Enterovibrio norvegicus]|uniref:ABC transporter ATP-binding protein n=1 Tax=Enterovibrio norvegicus TaxID=188144 RepID=A0A2N7LCW2_9GAMM|nr:ATP-binding cassette domain-containing protein [Enterovibrio norvegicus]PMN65423.1 ABC transporter ATP-binding protein [Enterovibrio norvegicus]PMN93170.1 ABC transporter ATP-binding protein [Enterovibrio norvegicus]